ncbi:hypothetical protein ALC57_09744 [Trachymyrmex cornetzi]|uniref:Ig-like domain-containing protein n=1 Tax=Trachymyrmex cornetzi TaxID=471704 RepID=A0A151J520_9HYME|nr:hypothetical protein ALC57_09744 [Trachymyrmex cornetzi]
MSISALFHLNDDTFGKGEKSQRGPKKTYFFKDTPQKLTVAIGQAAVLLCRVKNLGNRTGLRANCNYLRLIRGTSRVCMLDQVSWIRKRDLHILTSMSVTYTSDARFTVVGNPETDDWNLRIDYVQPRDAGIYECQVNTEPKIYSAVTLKVLDIQASITPSRELFIKTGSTISLTCVIELQDLPPSNVTWYHSGAVIDFDGPSARAHTHTHTHVDFDENFRKSILGSNALTCVTFDRGGVSLETEKGKSGTTSKLLITRAQIEDSGNYTCASNKVTPASIMVHVLNGEHPAAMQHGGTGKFPLVCQRKYLTFYRSKLMPNPLDIDLNPILNAPVRTVSKSETRKNACYTRERRCPAQNSALLSLLLR